MHVYIKQLHKWIFKLVSLKTYLGGYKKNCKIIPNVGSFFPKIPSDLYEFFFGKITYYLVIESLEISALKYI